MSNNPPDGIVVSPGSLFSWQYETFGNDNICWDETMPFGADGSYGFSGSSGGDSALETDPDTNRVTWEPGLPLLVEGWARSKSSHIDTFFLKVIWEKSDYSIISTSTVFSGTCDAADTWELKSGVVTAPANTAFYRLKWGLTDGGGSGGWWAALRDSAFPKGFAAHLSSAQSIPTGVTTTQIQFDSEDFDYGSVYDNSTNFRFTAPSPGVFSVNAKITLQSSADQTQLVLAMNKNGSQYANDIRTVSGVCSITAAVNETLILVAGDYIDMRVSHNHGSNRTIYGTFSVVQIM